MNFTTVRNYKLNYDANVSADDLRGADLVIIDPEAEILEDLDAIHEIKSRGTFILTYLAPLEVNPYRKLDGRKVVKIIAHRNIRTLGINPKWGSIIVDPAAKAWSDLYLEMADQWKDRVDGFFLDAADAYWDVPGDHSDAQRLEWAAHTAALINRLKLWEPGKLLLLNRGYEMLNTNPAVIRSNTTTAFLCESLYRSREGRVKESETQELVECIGMVRRLGMTHFVLDYIPNGNKAQAANCLAKIAKLGAIGLILQYSLSYPKILAMPQRKPKVAEPSRLAAFSP